ncbi:techylectin-5A-like [Lytechinus variegatus]|uniref:techylectin-5A-like n=1 Tax=Lytechinus variegatus TaxID=7654 RepID=UPI001BB153E3|nr:techylectin-5A-like [Lytechinus variegatus]
MFGYLLTYSFQDEKTSPSPGQPVDCADIQGSGANVSGVYAIYLGKYTNVYCDMETDGGGWTVFQRRIDGSEDFNRNWLDYTIGFGSIGSEHWLGNDLIHRLSSQRNYELRVDLADFEGNTRYANYGFFHIGNETLLFILTVRGYSGNAGNGLNYHNGHTFSTADCNNNLGCKSSCGRSYRSGWWFNKCILSNLNGKYLHGQYRNANGDGVAWGGWNIKFSMKMSEMKIRPNQDSTQI